MSIVRITSWSNEKSEFTGLQEGELEKMQSAAAGVAWVRVNGEGRVEKESHFSALPKPTDAAMEPFWRKNQNVQSSLKLDDFEPLPNWSSPSISIQHLCGYGYTPENYAAEAENLELWGFVCMRSKRGSDGRYHEIWYLPAFFYAKNELKEAITQAGKDVSKQAKAVTSFLARNARFGSLDMSCQRMAMTID